MAIELRTRTWLLYDNDTFIHVTLEPPYAIFRNSSPLNYQIRLFWDDDVYDYEGAYTLDPGDQVRIDLLDTTTLHVKAARVNTGASPYPQVDFIYFKDTSI